MNKPKRQCIDRREMKKKIVRPKELTLGAFTGLFARGQTFFSGTPLPTAIIINPLVQLKSMAQRCVAPQAGVEVFIKHNHNPAISQIEARSW
jgi:hypothetical protein